MTAPLLPRVLGKYAGTQPGPLLICLAGIHGNEPAGVYALQQLFDDLNATNPEFRGTLVGLCGNRQALNNNQRFVDSDLNRAWQSCAPQLFDQTHEGLEKRELHQELCHLLNGFKGKAFFLDLHTSSAGGAPFACIGDTIRNRRFARSFPTPKILGLEEQIDGALLEFLNNLGLTTIGFEGGQHHDKKAVENHYAAVWCALAGAKCIKKSHPQAQKSFKHLQESSKGCPSWVGIRYRHAVEHSDEFKMRPGFNNFDKVSADYLLATHNSQAIHSFYKSRIILPLYQGLGDDGFFLANDINPFWLGLSRWLRRLKCDHVVHWLPGVKRSVSDPSSLEVNSNVARWLVVEIFHLLGFRKRRQQQEKLIFSRRKFDLNMPNSYSLD
ncbi:MAG: succinylglutamate desuccinylase/aspartoacylase family protein [Planctomycetes bacterium]|nr:succinylglutamate desuccinylase/aspartoacylase family protein [Planctomycetota bacterium]